MSKKLFKLELKKIKGLIESYGEQSPEVKKAVSELVKSFFRS